MSMLKITNLGISFGGLRAVDDFNVEIEKGELYGLIGPNGAGKNHRFQPAHRGLQAHRRHNNPRRQKHNR